MSPGIEDCHVEDQASLKAWLASKAESNLSPQDMVRIVRLIDHAQALRTMILAAEDALWDWSITEDQMYCSPQVWQALGCEAASCTQPMAFWRDLVHAEDLPLFRRGLLAHWQGMTPKFELYFRARAMPPGSTEWLWAYVCGEVTGVDAKGRVTRMSGSLRNITPEMQLRAQLREREHQLRLIARTDGPHAGAGKQAGPQADSASREPVSLQMAPTV